MDKEEKMLISLQSEIDQKCFAIKQKKMEARWTKLFLWSCVLFVVLPTVLIFAGVNLFMVFLPVAAYLGFCILLFIAVLLNSRKWGGVLV